MFAFSWTLLELVFCILGVAAVVCWFGHAGFEFLRSLESPWSGSGEGKKPSALSGKEKNKDDPLLQATSTSLSRVRMGTTPTEACPWDWTRLQDGWTSPSALR